MFDRCRTKLLAGQILRKASDTVLKCLLRLGSGLAPIHAYPQSRTLASSRVYPPRGLGLLSLRKPKPKAFLGHEEFISLQGKTRSRASHLAFSWEVKFVKKPQNGFEYIGVAEPTADVQGPQAPNFWLPKNAKTRQRK